MNTHEKNSVKSTKAKVKEKNTVYRNNVKKNEMNLKMEYYEFILDSFNV